jgi:nitrite reductase/ring-hydroxylating ferredoxin subunit
MWHRAVKASEMPKSSGRTVDLGGTSIALFNVAGKFYATRNACIHRGGPLGEGHLEGVRVTCPWHAWEFDVTSGECSTMKGAKQITYSTRIEKGEIWVEIKDE